MFSSLVYFLGLNNILLSIGKNHTTTTTLNFQIAKVKKRFKLS